MRGHINQYFRDLHKLVENRNCTNKTRLFFTYNRYVLKNILFTKLFKIKTHSDCFVGYKINYDNFNSFFAMFSEIFLHNIYGEMQIKTKNPVIVDCGANIGIATLYFKYKYPEAEIISFEPDPKTFLLLKKNIQDNNLDKVQIYNQALSNSNGKIKFYSYGDFEGSPGNTIQKQFVNFTNVKEHEVDCIKLSSLGLKHIDLLKIDVEGAEGRIVRDLAESGLLANVDKISLEYHYGTKSQDNNLSYILEKLEERGFDYVINPDSLTNDYIAVEDCMNAGRYVLIINCFKRK